MFGHIQANLADLSDAEKQRYRGAYCGLCRSLGKRHGQIARLSLSYDLAFLAMLLSSLYEPQESCSCKRCMLHPLKKCHSITNPYSEYAADMTVLLSYYKCMDDWQDERKPFAFFYAKCLEKRMQQIKQLWPRQCTAVEKELKNLSEIEKNGFLGDAAANCFGHLLEEIFVYREDHWEEALRDIGRGLGRYIYYADAAIDYEKDRKKHNYNPLNDLSVQPDEMRPMLMMLLGEASNAFEYLPLERDKQLLSNVIYSGLWMKYNQGMYERRKRRDQDDRRPA